MAKEKMYSIAVRKKQNDNESFWEHKDFVFKEFRINCGKRYWLADPFVFEKDGVTYLFYEAYDLILHRGKIGYSIITDENTPSEVHIVIDEPYHLSFPYIFEQNGDIFIMPETCGNNTVKFFRASTFPTKWEEHKTIIDDIFACDSIFINSHRGKYYLIANEMYRKDVPNNNYSSCWVKNYLYPLHNDLTIAGERTLIAEGDYGIRNAGKSFSKDNTLYRVGQNCMNRLYGKGLVFFEVKSIEPYVEQIKYAMDCEEFDGHITRKNKAHIIGVHTYNFSEHYEVIDFSQMRTPHFATQFNRKFLYYYNYAKFLAYVLVTKIKRLVKMRS